MEEIVKLRIILDVEADVFRDIEIELDAPLMHLHLATLDAFNWNDANEMASFYKSNDAWDKGDEFPLMSMGPEFPSMETATVRELVPHLKSRGLYVYDYLRMWCFYIEPLELSARRKSTAYPRLMLEFGDTPNPLSRAPEGLDDAALMAEIFGESAGGSKPKKGSSKESTGDPELDAYLAEDDYDDYNPYNDRDDDDEEGGYGGMDNIDDYDELY